MFLESGLRESTLGSAEKMDINFLDMQAGIRPANGRTKTVFKIFRKRSGRSNANEWSEKTNEKFN
jgi:hypothetical protein